MSVETIRMGFGAGGEGSYSLSGTGSLTADTIYVGYGAKSQGTFIQTGGTSTVTNRLSVGYGYRAPGAYTLSGGQLTVQTLKVGVGPHVMGPGTFLQDGGVNHVTGTLYVGNKDNTYGSNAHGAYTLSAGTLNADGGIVIGDGDGSRGRFEWFGGTLNTPEITLFSGKRGTLVLDRSFDAADWAGGTLIPGTTITGLEAAVFEATGGATITNTGAEMEISRIRIGTSQGEATYDLSGTGRLVSSEYNGDAIWVGYETGAGTLNVNGAEGVESISIPGYIQVGHNGAVTHTGGSVTAGGLKMAGTYTLRDTSVLSTDSTILVGPLEAPARFVQDGGVHTTSGRLVLGAYSSVHSGIYELNAGELTADEVLVGTYPGSTGAFLQNGGTVTTNYLEVIAGSRYVYAGGTLQTGQIVIKGELDFDGRSATLALAGGLVDLSEGQILNASNATMTVGPDSLTVVAPGFDPQTTFSAFSTEGVVYTRGSPLVVSAGESVVVAAGSNSAYPIEDPLQCEGTFRAGEGHTVWVKGGLWVSGEGSVSLGAPLGQAWVSVDDQTSSGQSGGTISTTHMYVGHYGSGRFVHTGGVSDHVWLVLGDQMDANGTYELRGTGYLRADMILVGRLGVGSVLQSGGRADAVELFIGGGEEGEGDGTYRLSDGILAVSEYLTVGGGGTGRFVHTGGSATVDGQMLRVGNPGPMVRRNATYELSGPGAEVTTTDLWVTEDGSFVQTDGTCTVRGTLEIRPGRMEISGGILRVHDAVVASEGPAPGFGFTQTGGAYTVENRLRIGGAGRDEPGRLLLSGTGELSTNQVLIGGRSEGLFRQDGGTHTMAVLQVEANGRYEYAGGALEIQRGTRLMGEFDFADSDVTLNVAGGADVNFSEGAILRATNASIVAQADTLLRFPAGFDPLTDLGSLVTEGVIHVAGEVLEIPHGQTIHSEGLIDGGLTNAGELQPGHSPGILEIQGDFSQTVTGRLVMELAGSDNANPETTPQHDQVLISGQANLGGVLELVFLDRYRPIRGEELELMSFGSHDGRFADVVGLDLLPGLSLIYGDRALMLLATATPGDADLDGFIDDNDLSTLLAHWGAGGPWAAGNFNGDGVINDDDLSLLLAHWSGRGGEVPEPGTGVLAIFGLLMALRMRFRPRQP